MKSRILKSLSLVCFVGVSLLIGGNVEAGFFNVACSGSSCGTKLGLAACLKSKSAYNTIDDIKNGGDPSCASTVQTNCQNNPDFYTVTGTLAGVSPAIVQRLNAICPAPAPASTGCADETCQTAARCTSYLNHAGNTVNDGCIQEVNAYLTSKGFCDSSSKAYNSNRNACTAVGL